MFFPTRNKEPDCAYRVNVPSYVLDWACSLRPYLLSIYISKADKTWWKNEKQSIYWKVVFLGIL